VKQKLIATKTCGVLMIRRKGNIMRHVSLVFLILITVSFSVKSEEISRIIAKISNQVITSQDLEDYCRVLAYRNNEYSEISELDNANFKKTALDRLIEDRLILEEAKKEAIEIPRSVIDENFRKMVKTYQSRKDFENSLIAKGLNVTLLKERIKEQYLMRQAINQNVRAFVTVSPQEITSYYENHQQDFLLPPGYVFYIAKSNDSVYLNEILKTADEQGLDLTKNKYKDDLMQMKSTKNKLKPELAKCLEELDNNQCEITKIEESFYIICLEEKISARVPTLDEAKEIVYSYLSETKFKQEFKRWIDRLKENSIIEKYYE